MWMPSGMVLSRESFALGAIAAVSFPIGLPPCVQTHFKRPTDFPTFVLNMPTGRYIHLGLYLYIHVGLGSAWNPLLLHVQVHSVVVDQNHTRSSFCISWDLFRRRHAMTSCLVAMVLSRYQFNKWQSSHLKLEVATLDVVVLPWSRWLLWLQLTNPVCGTQMVKGPRLAYLQRHHYIGKEESQHRVS